MSALATNPASSQSASRLDRRGAATLRVALLGCGNIGSALVAELERQAATACGSQLTLTAVLVRDAQKHRHVRSAVTTIDEVLLSNPDVVVECMGGVAAPAQACERALRAGIHVVSANKSMVAAELPALRAAAHAGNAQLRFDAAVCAGVPVLDAVARLRSARIVSLRGIVNGTCNFILHAIAQRAIGFDDAVRDAIARGYAEPDPSADLSGQDSAEKLRLLAEAAGFGMPSTDDVLVQGVQSIDRASLHDIRSLGHEVRLLASVQRAAGTIRSTVFPTIVDAGSPFAAAVGTQNVLQVETELAGTVTMSGPGAGARPTVAALLADILACAGSRREQAPIGTNSDATTTSRDGPQPWLLRISSRTNRLPPPQELTTLATQHGAQLHGAAFLPGRALLQLHSDSSGTLSLIAALQRHILVVQRFAIAPEVTLRF